MTILEWNEVEPGERWAPIIDGVETIGLDVTRNMDGDYVAFDGTIWLHAESAQNHSLRLINLLPQPKSTVWVVSDGNEILYVASTEQKAAEWALNNGHVLAPIVERTVDG